MTPWLTAYASFNDIFSPQNNNFRLDDDGTALPAGSRARGETIEGGLRFKLRDGKLNGSVAYYDTVVRGRQVRLTDVTNPFLGINCCFSTAGKSLSKGVDVELNGEIFDGFQVAASYNYNDNKVTGFPLRPDQPDVLSSLFPKHQVKLWASYDFQSGFANGLTVASGLRAGK